MSGRWDENRDHPLSYHWRPVDLDAYEMLGLPTPKTGAEATARSYIITEALVALRHEAKRLGLKQRELATQLCLGRPQLSNLQQGRFGASAEAAERIRNFLIGSAKTVGGGTLAGVDLAPLSTP